MLSTVLLKCVLLAAIVVGAASGQYAAIAQEEEPGPDKSPHSAPEPHRKLTVDPDAVIPRLLSRDARERAVAFSSIGLEFMAERDPQDVRLLAVNIDSDVDVERVLIVKSHLDAAAVVLKKENDTWWELGTFVCCGPTSSPADPFVELRQTVSYGTNDVIVHAGGKQGTGVGERRLMIYRAWGGHLYNVFDIVEEAYNLSGSEDTRISYPDTDSSNSPRVITVHRTKEFRNRRRTTCVPYRWDAGKFTFVQTAPDPKLCGGH